MRALLACAGLLLAPFLAIAQPSPSRVEDNIAQRMLACTGCHGSQGRAGPDGYYPRIAGKPAGYLYQQLAAFRDGRRRYGLMTTLLTGLPDDYLREMAAYFAALDVPYPAPQPAAAPAALLDQGRRLVLEGDPARRLPACVSCHGAAMTGVQPAVPGLLGLPRDYLTAQLGAWRTGTRQALAPDCMAEVVRAMQDEEIGAVAQYLASVPVPGGGKPAASLPAPLPLHCVGVPR